MTKKIVTGSLVILSLLANNANATVLYWDNNGTSTPTSGKWDTTTANWATSATLSASTIAYNTADAACFTGGTASAGTLTITVTNATLAFAGIFNGYIASTYGCNLTIASGGSSSALSLASGLQGFGIASGYTTTITVPIIGAGEVDEQGSGNLALYASNSYTGGTQTTGGQLIYYNQNHSFGTGTINIAGSGNALVSGATTNVVLANAVTFPTAGYALNLAGGNAGTTFTGKFTLPTSGTTILETSSSASESVTITGVISGASALTVADAGTLVLGGANTYTGATTIGNGLATPLVFLTNGGSIGNSAVTVSNTCTFGSWTTATTSVSNALTYSSGAKALFTGSGSSVGQINVKGNLSLNNTAVTIKVTGTALQAGSYTLLNCSGTVSGVANATPTFTGSGIAAGLSASIQTTANAVILGVGNPPAIGIAPAVVSVASGSKYVITATNSGTISSYQWQLNGGPLTGDVVGSTTSSALTINPVQDQDAGTYTVTAISPLGNVSASGFLIVVDSPQYSAGSTSFTLNFTGPVNTGFRIWSSTNLNVPIFGNPGWTLVDAGEQFQAGGNSFTDTSASSTNGEYYSITVP